MKTHIVCLDTETTGLDKTKDRIVQLALTKFNSKTRKILESKVWYILPSGEWHIEESATDVHGLTDEFIRLNGVLLKEVYPEFLSFIKDCDLLTYNGNAFDWNFIQREFEREGLDSTISDGTHKLYDSFFIETIHNSHKLSDVYRRYTGKELEDAHDALADVNATIEVFFNQLDRYDDIEETNEEPSIRTLLSPEGFVNFNDNGDLVFSAGKYRSKLVVDICKTDMGYLKWLNENNVITKPTKAAIATAWKRYRDNY